MIPAEFEGLAEHRVAVVCLSESSSSFGPRPVSEELCREVSRLLAENVRKIELIEPQKVQSWMDEHDWNQVDYREIGKGVGAEYLVAVDILSFSLHDGQTMYKGRAEVSIAVYNLTGDGDEVFRSAPPEIHFPVNGSQHTTDISEKEFRRRFINIVAQRVARHFYPYDFKDDFASDPTLVSG
jgi:hypothetical protein